MQGNLLGVPVLSEEDRRRAGRLYADLVGSAQPGDADFWRQSLNGQIFLGDEGFVQRLHLQAAPARREAPGILKAQRGLKAGASWGDWLSRSAGRRDMALLRAYGEGGLKMTKLARDSGLSMSHVSRLIARREKPAGDS